MRVALAEMYLSEACNGADDDCDGTVDEGFPPNCEECPNPQPEVCNNQDDDCDNQVDEGLINACGECGPDPAETCNGLDEDCDGRADEGGPMSRRSTLPLWDLCWPMPDE